MLKLLYTHENRIIVSNIANLLEQNHLNIHLKNEYAGAAAGDIVPHETWLEIWVDQRDLTNALSIINDIDKNAGSEDWYCQNCGETNPNSFELCWHCQTLR
jgi:hypothetical protein